MAQALIRSLLFLLGAGMHKTLRASSKSGAFFSLSPVEFLGGCSSHCQTSRLGSLIWGSELSLLWENFCGIIIFQFMNFPHGRYGIWFYCFWEPLLPSCCGLFFVFGCRVSFFFFSRFQCFFGWCLFISYLLLWCFHKKRWAHILLLCHFVSPKVGFKIHCSPPPYIHTHT